MAAPQTLQNHARLDPPYHFFALPILLINVIVAIVLLVRHLDQFGLYGWWVVVSLALLVGVGNSRPSALRAQDRTIRLEEKLRYAALLSAEQNARAQALTLRQIIALRFASDAELPGLIDRSLAENLSGKQIKLAIANWRPDTLRV
jgi:hypothetical protein